MSGVGTIYREAHHTSTVEHVNPDRTRRMTRRVQNHINHYTKQTGWQPSAPSAQPAGGPPPDWEGGYEFSRAALKAPLQCFYRDALDVGNRALVGCRLSKSPGSWLNKKAMNVNPVDATFAPDGRQVRYDSVWDGCNLVYDVGAAQNKESIEIHDWDAAPDYFEFSIKVPGSHTFEVDEAAGTYTLRDANGDSKIHTKPIYAYDSATTYPHSITGAQPIRVTMTYQGKVAGNHVIRLTLNPEDMASAIGMVTIDPTDSIFGDGVVHENHMRNDVQQWNQGATAFTITGRSGGGVNYYALYRFETSAIPAGAVTGFRFNGYHNGGTRTAGNTLQFHRLLVPWGEGNKNGSPAGIGESAGNWSANPTLWGSSFASTAGVDYATPSVVDTYAIPAKTWTNGENFQIPFANDGLAWPEAWRDLVYGNYGFVCHFTGATTNSYTFWYSSEDPTYNSGFEIDYTAGPATSPYYAMMMRSTRGG